jgi:hypothetical protein
MSPDRRVVLLDVHRVVLNKPLASFLAALAAIWHE